MQNELVFVGLGRMGAAMVEHLVEQDFCVHGFDVDKKAREAASAFGTKVYNSLSESISAMRGRRVVWLMVPSKFVDDVLGEVVGQLAQGDVIIDGGNSYFKDTIRRGDELKSKGIEYIDCGTSGGMKGARYGAALMVGGGLEVVSDIESIFKALAIKDGYARVGDIGAGHFVKMVHNGIEYGMMGALAEGMNYVEEHGKEMKVDIEKVLNPYQHGSIISSALMDWLADSYRTDGYLEAIAGEVPRGETEEEMESIIKSGETPILESSVKQRKATRGNPSRVGVLLSAMRNQFGGHAVVKKGIE